MGKMSKLILLALCAVAVSARSTTNERIIGGSATTIDNYPSIAVPLYSPDGVSFGQFCGATILNQRTLMTAAHCFDEGRNIISRWRFRLGSSFASSGGTVYNAGLIIVHPSYDETDLDHDIALMRSSSTIVYIANAVQPASIAGTNYNLADNEVVWAAGWGLTEFGWDAEQLRHVQIWTVNQAICRERYSPTAITDNMLCAGWLDVGGRDQCQGDSGSPLYHNNVVVGVCSWGEGCASAFYPGVNIRVSRYATWIQQNA